MKQILTNKWFLFFILILFLLVPSLLYLTQSKAPTKSEPSFSQDSTIVQTANTTYVSLQPQKDYLYKTRASGLDGAIEFINSNPSYNSKHFIPPNFAKNSTMETGIKDTDDPTATAVNPSINAEHYFFNQMIKGIPVYRAQLAIHLRNGNEIYFVEGNLVQNDTVDRQQISQTNAEEVAMQTAKQQAPKSATLMQEKTEAYIFNKKALGLDEDEKNYLTLGVTIKNINIATKSFKKRYFIDLTSGHIIYEEDLNRHAINRVVYDCRNGSCTLARSEGQPAKGGGVDAIYNDMGSYYNFLRNTLQRDGLDGRGGKMIGRLMAPCRNAQADDEGVEVCSDMLYSDVIWHELTHTLLGKIRDIGTGVQSNTFHEGNADVFSMTIGPDYILSAGTMVARNAQNPASMRQPDYLFSPNWKCPDDDHENSTVISHAFYLMAEGGTLKNCSITGLGKTIAIKVQYQAIVKYLTANSNFRTYYTAMINACNDLYGSNSNNCRQIKAALVAAEIDQQPANSQKGAKCSGLQEKPVVCPAGTTPTVAPSRIPTTAPTNSPSSTPLPVPSANCLGVPCPGSPTPTMPQTTQLPTQPLATVGPTSGGVIPTEPPSNEPTIAQPTSQPGQGTNNPGKAKAAGGLLMLLFGLLILFLRLILGLG